MASRLGMIDDSGPWNDGLYFSLLETADINDGRNIYQGDVELVRDDFLVQYVENAIHKMINSSKTKDGE